ncbi:MAG: SpaA isopeptide-forming pilin-related protein, partial [Bacillota bacterium]|nr:SpaA isopeptide-forming pilin-related protein [Bacillota bacterium]
GQVYRVYRMFELESYNAESGAYAYKVSSNSPWYSFVQGVGSAYVSADAQGYITWTGEKTDKAYAAFASAALAFAKANSILPDSTVGPIAEGQSTAVLQDVPLGYYLVDSSLGSLCILDTTNPDANIFEKNDGTDVGKEVKEDSTAVFGERNDAELGELVEFKNTITAGAGAEKYVMHDKMYGLTFKEVTGVTLNGKPVPTDAYTVRDQNLSHDCTFEVIFSDSFCASLVENDEIIVYYTATVNSDAVIRDEGNPNETWVSYGEFPTTSTEKDITRTYVWDFNIKKFTTYLCPDDNCFIEEFLADAAFYVFREYSETISGQLYTGKEYAVFGVNGRFSHWTRVETEATNLVSDENGNIKVSGLDSGVYYLKETQAPDGYNILTEPVKIVIKSDGTVTDNRDEVLADNTIKIENKSGTILPSTGGAGTTLFYVLGGALVLAAAVLLITKKRMSSEG